MVKRKKQSKTTLHKAVKKSGKADRFAELKAKPVKICMKCGSLHINILPTSVHLASVAGQKGGGSVKYQCETCGYIDAIFPEVEQKDIEHFRQNLHKVPQQKRIAVQKQGPRGKASCGLFIGAGSFLCLAGLITIMIDVLGNFDMVSIYLSFFLVMAGVAMIVTGVKAKGR